MTTGVIAIANSNDSSHFLPLLVFDESYYSSRSESGSSIISSSSSSSSHSSGSGGDSQSKGEFISCWNAFTMGVNAAAAVGNDRMCCGGHGGMIL